MANCSHEVLRLITPDEYGDARLYAKEACLIMDAAKAELDTSPITTESLIQEFGFQQVKGGYEDNVALELPEGYELSTMPIFKGRDNPRTWDLGCYPNVTALSRKLQPRTKGQLRRLLALIQDIQASLEGEEGQG